MGFSTWVSYDICFSVLEIRSNIIAQLVFRKQILPPDVLTSVTLGKYVERLVRNNNSINFAQNLLNR
jgi:hypothetical protein